MKRLKKIPKFKTEAEEQKFWQGRDSSEYLHWGKAKEARFPELQKNARMDN